MLGVQLVTQSTLHLTLTQCCSPQLTDYNIIFPLTGEDGPSQMALEDFAMFRTIPGAVCFYPSDAVSAERAIELAANHRGVTFTRTSRPATPVVYANDTKFEIGKSKV